MKPGDSPRPKALIPVLFVLVLCLMVEAVSFGGLWALRRTRGITWFPKASKLSPQATAGLDSFLASGTGRQMRFDSTIGWRSGRPDISAAGTRSDREYEPIPPAGVLRVAAFGDSFTYGADVPLVDSWSYQMEALVPGIEVLNYGVGAFGLDQAFLRYLRDGKTYAPHIVFIGYLSENIARNVNVFRGFYTDNYPGFFFSKPRFIVDSGRLVLVPNPLSTLSSYRRFRDSPEVVLRELGRHDHHFVGNYPAGPLDFSRTVRLGKIAAGQLRKRKQVPVFTPAGGYDTRSEAYEVTLRIFDEFHQRVLADGATPVIVVFPDLEDQAQSRAGRPRRYEPLLAYFRSKNYRYIDVLEAFEAVESQYSVEDLTVEWGHLSKLGNELAARLMIRRLDEWNLADSVQRR